MLLKRTAICPAPRFGRADPTGDTLSFEAHAGGFGDGREWRGGSVARTGPVRLGSERSPDRGARRWYTLSSVAGAGGRRTFRRASLHASAGGDPLGASPAGSPCRPRPPRRHAGCGKRWPAADRRLVALHMARWRSTELGPRLVPGGARARSHPYAH